MWIGESEGIEFNLVELPKVFGKSGGFSHLLFFTIWGFESLEELPGLEEGAMAYLEEFVLEEFVLWDCPKLKKVPEGLEQLKKLKQLNYGCSGTNGWSEILKEGGEYWKKIKAINPSITITIRGL
ncbi:hypothetical protein SUGI_0066110 [Cryptomeria japonica]|nr:hypothetical protein SUGI_0066110 [Cryptomeria japonica]